MDTDLVGDLEGLCLLRCLGLLERGLEAGLDVLWQRRGAGDGDVELALVGCDELVEALDDALGLDEAAVLGEDDEEVLRDVNAVVARLGVQAEAQREANCEC